MTQAVVQVIVGRRHHTGDEGGETGQRDVTGRVLPPATWLLIMPSLALALALRAE